MDALIVALALATLAPSVPVAVAPATEQAATAPVRVVPPPVVATIPLDQLPAAEADIVVSGRSDRGDPMAAINVETFKATQAVDKAIIGPAARAYTKSVPSPLRAGLRNFLGNLREPVVAINYLLQLKPGKAAEVAGRFAINSTIGVAGVFDIAKRRPFGLRKRRNSFANTLGLYGVKQGPFFFLPLVGPTTLRDLIGTVVDQVIAPIQPVQPFRDPKAAIPIGALSALDYRAAFDPELTRIQESADPYGAARRYYLDRRQAEIDAIRGRMVRGRVTPPPVVATLPAEGAASLR